ncbi:DUF262 domain-containing protein [uncultured Ruminococcus sp.]|uniref:DUF262 domain-containing protein n=1 Tax=uncultured Ruminococcus sp. TaxID=165186 RepID=UPI00266FEDF1|nr:DUF262 domain-containing protein [uncultured Ruminococcus sp.]
MENIDEKLEFELAEDETEYDYRPEISKFSEAVIWGTDWTTETIARQLKKGNIDLNPTFQRRDAWSDVEKSKLIESLMLGIPVPPIILAENKDKNNSYLVIDGKQRLLSIRRFYSDLSEQDSFKQLKLKGLEILNNLNGLTYQEIEDNYNEFITNIDNQSIRTIVIKNWPDEDFLYTVFLRLNTGSKKLSPQELRQALKPGPFLSYLDEATANSTIIKKMLKNKRPDPRMKDIELSLRFFAFKYNIESYNGNLKVFLDDTCELLNNSWSEKEEEIVELFFELEKAIEFSYGLFPKNPFSRYRKGICNNKFNRAIFEIFSYYFSDPSIRRCIGEKQEEFIDEFIKLNDDSDFISAVSNTTKDVNRIIIRYNKFSDLLSTLCADKEIKIKRFILNEYRIEIEEVTS